MKLSIIMPIYNVEAYIDDCLKSIYSGGLDSFEVICIDDCGNDNSIKLLKAFIKDNKISNINVVKHSVNKGLSTARNTGLMAAKGDYICFLDSDDMIDSAKLNKLVCHAIDNKLDILEGSYSEVFETNMNIQSGAKCHANLYDIVDGDEYFYQMCRNGSFVPMVWCKVYSRKYLLKNKFKFKDGLKFEDEEYSPRVIIGANRVQYVDEEFYIYRRRDNSITTDMVKDNRWVDHYLVTINSLTSFCEKIKNKKSYCALKDRMSEIVLSLYKNPIAYGAKKSDFDEIVSIVKRDKLYNIPLKSSKFSVKIQGLLMKHPRLFTFLYKLGLKVK